MYGLLINREKIKDVRDAVIGSQIWFEEAGVFSQEEFLQHCQSASNVELQTLIVDMDCTDETSLIKGLRTFRNKRLSRIILIAPGRKPGDPTISSLLSLQVWDIVAPEEIDPDPDEEDDFEEGDYEEEDPNSESYLTTLLKLQISSDFGYGNAARWDVQNQQLADPEKPKTKGKNEDSSKAQKMVTDPSIIEHIHSITVDPPTEKSNKVTLLETIIGTVLVSVIGVETNAATTHTALLVANYLVERGYKVAIVEANQNKDFERIEYVYEGMKGYKSSEQTFSIHDVDYYKSSSALDMAQLHEKEYDYIVLDLGAYADAEYIEEFFRSNVQIIVGHGSEWRQTKLFDFSQSFKDRDQTKWIYAVPFADELTISDIKEELKSGVVTLIPSHPDPWTSNKETDAVLDSILLEYLGQRMKKGAPSYLYGIIIAAAVVIVILVLLLLQQ
ncbi:hypothetical protein [Paenibacillus agilis]|uniref:Uncharacterized protein n=1 Tax=Paenibacillus agilis TaxID=3020863 RepID=A0A559ID69_9BACL|nr:hypothetical protein [Paenibacillus agilis]TVX85622.1 hypothetical protein FPZ44_25045 [Paenibacillus agilis]